MTDHRLLTVIRFFSVILLTLMARLSYGAEVYHAGDTFSQPLPSGGNGPEMIVIREGSYVFGGGRKSEDPETLVVEIARPFAISKTEITAGMYRQFLTATKSARRSHR